MTAQDLAILADAAKTGLGGNGQKWLPCQYLYDSVGSALFDTICLLPEYGLSRAGDRLLRLHCGALAERFSKPLRVIELGAGSGQKTRTLLTAMSQLRTGRTLTYYPVDISTTALDLCAQGLHETPQVAVVPLACDYAEGLQRATTGRRADEQILVLFLGSTIGNFDRPSAAVFLAHIQRCLRPGDGLLLATDLVKPKDVMLAAYDDSVGVTAAFNKNMLAHISRVLQGDIKPNLFTHEARWSDSHTRIEMHLRATQPMVVQLPLANLTVSLASNETIWTESSHKFTLGELTNLATTAGFSQTVQWVDQDWPFAHSLWVVKT